MNKNNLFYSSRRQILRGLLAATAFGITAKLGTGCTPREANNETGETGKELAIGFIYVGPKDDFGYNQSHAEGAAAIAKIPDVKVIEQENVPETTAVQEAMRSMIELDKATVLFPTSFGYLDPHILKIAEEFPEVQFFHAGGLYNEEMPDNIGSYFSYIDEAQYIAGIVDGQTSQSDRLGFVAAKPIPLVLRNINAFTLGAKSVNPKVSVQVIFTGDWALPIKEAEAVNSLVDRGVDVMTCHVDNPKVAIETAERRGIYTSGYHANQSALAPKGYLTGAEWNWTAIYTQYANWIKEGKTLMNGGISHLVLGGGELDYWKLSNYGSPVSEETRTLAEEAKQKLKDGKLTIYQGKIVSNKGEIILPEGKTLKRNASELQSMDWLVEGVEGSI
ncbi:MAG: BMP family ABC transporter substrate-binding protein [Spirulina sp.]